jgi:hypothetical protein
MENEKLTSGGQGRVSSQVTDALHEGRNGSLRIIESLDRGDEATCLDGKDKARRGEFAPTGQGGLERKATEGAVDLEAPEPGAVKGFDPLLRESRIA